MEDQGWIDGNIPVQQRLAITLFSLSPRDEPSVARQMRDAPVAGLQQSFGCSVGRRQIGGFYLPGDIFGLEFAEEHTFSAEAVSDARVVVVKRSAIAALAGRDPAIGHELFALTGRELRRVHDRMLLLVKSAQERVAGFLLEMAERAGAGNTVELPMSRQDIADYLGLTIETVSRTLTGLETAAAIEVPTSRRIVLRNRSALSRLNG